MKLMTLLLSFVLLSLTANAGNICTLNQVSHDAEAWLKLKHKEDVVVRSSPVGQGPWSYDNIPTSYTVKYVAIPKDPKYSDCCAMVGEMKFDVRADQTCDIDPHLHEESATNVKTDSSYTELQFMQDMRSAAP